MARKNPYGSTYIDPVSGMQSTIYPPDIVYNADEIIDPVRKSSKRGAGLGNFFGKAGNTLHGLKNGFGWSKNAGAKAFGKNLGNYATGANALMQGFNAVGNLGDVSDAQAETNSLLTDILRSSASNPLASSMLTSDQISMLNKIKRGTYDTEAGFGDVDLMGLLSSAGQGALTGGLMGGIPGALVGGIGGALNSNLERQAQDQGLINSQLEGLYQALIDAEQQYKAMRRPNFTGLGIKSQYQM